MITSDSD